MLKKVFRNPRVMQSLAWLGAKYISFVFKTCRWTFEGIENIQTYWDRKTPLIVCFWHGRMLMMPCAWLSKNPFSMLISAHPDGQIIAKVIRHYQIDTIVGSSSKGGVSALRSILESLKQGGTVGITPDGPRGPRFTVSEGVVAISKLSQVDILPCTYSTQRAFIVNSWDRFRVPLPFGKAAMCWGNPIKAPPKKASPEDLEVMRHQIEQALSQLCDKADLISSFVDKTGRK